MHNSLLVLTVSVLLGMLAMPQTRRVPKTANSPIPPPPLTAREIARRSLPSVVLLIGQDAKGRAVTMGSGFFVQPDIIATNNHVIEEASRAYAIRNGFDEKFEIEGTIGIDEENDLALLKMGKPLKVANPYLVPKPATSLGLARENLVEIGEEVYALGNPEGFEGTFSQGIVSALRGSDYIQITAAISHGSSGGPVLNANGQVIGVAASTIEEGQNLNFAIPIGKLFPLMRNTLIVTPLDTGRLRFDGLYWFSGLSDRGTEFVKYIRFYKDGNALSVASSPDIDPKRWFSGIERTHTGSGRYRITGSEIIFSTNLNDRTRSDHAGLIQKNSLTLNSYQHFSGKNVVEEYRFVKIKVSRH